MKLGAYDYVLKPFDIPHLKQLLSEALAASQAMKQIVAFPTKLNPEESRQSIVGNSPAMQQVYKLIGQVAPTNTTILITGGKRHRQGAGRPRHLSKRLAAQQAVHRHQTAPRSPRTCSKANSSANEKGRLHRRARPAHRQVRAVRQRHPFSSMKIGDMPLTTQTKIYACCRKGKFRASATRLDQDRRPDHRATNKDCGRRLQRKEFREDLFYRLNVVRLNLPPLRERSTDVPLLVAYFINKFRLKQPTGPSQIADEAVTAIQNYTWPGNVRELENCIQRAMVLASGNTITLANLPRKSPNRTGAAHPCPRWQPVRHPRPLPGPRPQPARSRARTNSPRPWRPSSNSRGARRISSCCPPRNGN